MLFNPFAYKLSFYARIISLVCDGSMNSVVRLAEQNRIESITGTLKKEEDNMILYTRLFERAVTQIELNFRKIMSAVQNIEMQNNGNNEVKRVRKEEVSEKIIGTHNGTFHCDEALACFMLRKLPEYENAKIIRSRNIEMLRAKCDIIVDVGNEFDHKRKWYDHHQNSFQSTLSKLRPELGEDFQIRLSSAGLIYAYYGERIIDSILQQEANIKLNPEQLQICFIQIYRNFICEIDAIDNGVSMYDTDEKPRYKIHTHLSARMHRFNPSWEQTIISDAEVDELFKNAMAFVGSELVTNVVEIGKTWINARELVRAALLKSKEIYKTGEILLLGKFCPWKSHLVDLEKHYKLVGIPKLVVYQDTTGSWRISGVPISPESFYGRKFLPEPWRGLRSEDLCEVAGVPDLEFVHHTGFIGGALTKDAALAMAIKSIEFNNNEKAEKLNK